MKQFFALCAALLLSVSQATGVAASAAEPWEPRTSRMNAPQGLGEGRALEGAGIPGSYVRGASLALTEDGAICASPLEPREMIRYAVEWEDGEPLADMWEFYAKTPSNLIVQNDSWAYIIADSYTGDPNDFDDSAVYAEWLDEIIPLGGPDEARIAVDDPPCVGPMLLVEDIGLLLVAGPTGQVYACEPGATEAHAIEGVVATEFVYHGGVICFANLNDVKTYPNVYYESAVYDEPADPVDLRYPRLYSVNPDGTGLAKLTECGVRGLASWGPHIVYQNLDDGFITALPEMSERRFMHGALYGFDANGGEHRPLAIESDKYFATPCGLAVWHHGASLEFYSLDIDADLVLHAYDGTPLYRLDAGPAEFHGPYGLGDGVIVFCSVNEWWTGKLTFHTVPLDGSPKQEGIAVAEPDEEPDPAERTDASWQWLYELEGGEATIVGYWDEPSGDFTLPSELDGYPVMTIGNEVFYGCDELVSVVIPDGVTSIGYAAFGGCGGLTSVTIPDSVTNIVRNPFIGCPITAITMSSDNVAYELIDGVLFDREQGMLVTYPGGREGAYAIPEGVTSIGDDAFENACT